MLNKFSLQNKHILLGLSGSVAIHKAIQLVEMLRQLGAVVKIIATPNAAKFLHSTEQIIGDEEDFYVDIFSADMEDMTHIELAKWADCYLLAPATASLLSRCATGLADQLISLTYLATAAPVFMVPAMNQLMWTKPAVQRVVAQLQQDGVELLGPEYGTQACGDVGYGRMLEPKMIIAQLEVYFSRFAAGLTVLITAGATQEAIDPVRYISNHSSGKMGYALAEAFKRAGATVCLVSGITSIPLPIVDEVIQVQSAAEMLTAVLANTKEKQLFISAAAVVDYTPLVVEKNKIKKHEQERVIALTKTQDIIHCVRKKCEAIFIIGFALETNNLLAYATEKLKNKRINLIIANQLCPEEPVFGSEYNQVTVISADGSISLPRMTKHRLAKKLVEIVCQARDKFL